ETGFTSTMVNLITETGFTWTTSLSRAHNRNWFHVDILNSVKTQHCLMYVFSFLFWGVCFLFDFLCSFFIGILSLCFLSLCFLSLCFLSLCFLSLCSLYSFFVFFSL